MRKILFRGKRIDSGEWEYGGCVFTENKVCLIYNQTHSIDLQGFTVEENSVGQFTGLTDKNGKKIFEGDIVVVPLSGKPAKGIIKYFKTDICGFTVITQPQYSNYVLQKNCAYEVIGNIHDNSELLGVEE